MISLMATGTPCRGPIGLPLRRHSSLCRACARACSLSMWAKALTMSSTAAMRSRQACVNSSEEAAPPAICAAACAAVSVDRSTLANSANSALDAVEVVRQPQRHARPEIHDDHANDHDQHIRHHAIKDLIE